jgi:hypothetical protein
MKRVRIKAVEVIGRCPADLTPEDQFEIAGMRLENPGGSGLCFLALSHVPISLWQLQSEARFFAHATCPGCITRREEENRVTFLLGHADKWELCRRISAYLTLSRQGEEPERARRLKEAAIEHQERGEWGEATERMGAALKAFERGAPC